MSSDLESLRIDRSLKGTQPTHRRWGWWLVILLVLIGGGAAVFQARGKVIQVEVISVQPGRSGEDSVVLNATGYIIAAHKIELAPKVMGRVAWVGVERADKVKQGQVLVRLEDDEFRARDLQAQGQLDAAKARLDELLHGSRPEEIDKAQAELDLVKEELASAKSKMERLAKMADAKAVSVQDMEDAQYRYSSQKAKVAAIQSALELVRKGPRIEQIEAQKAMVKQAEGTLALSQNDLANTLIKAPVTGTVLARNVEVGEYVTTGFVGEGGAKGYVVSLADLNELRVELDISQDDFAKVFRDQKCLVTTDAYPDRKDDGQVDLISPEANRQKATVQVRVKILKPDDLLRPEMNASVAFRANPQSATQPAEPMFLIPATAVKDGAVFVMEGNRARRRPVEIGPAHLKNVEVRKGLSAGEQVIVAPPQGLGDGQAVRVRM